MIGHYCKLSQTVLSHQYKLPYREQGFGPQKMRLMLDHKL